MTEEKIQRINELARKSKSVGLTEEEKAEQATLRQEFRNDFKRNLEAQLESCVIVDEEGNRRPVKPKK